MTITAVCHSYVTMYVRVLCPCSGIVPGLPTELEPTLHIALFQVALTLHVVFGVGEDAHKPDTSKTL